MDYVITDGVRKTIVELDEALCEVDRLVEILACRATSYGDAIDAGAKRIAAEKHVAAIAARLVSHATLGKRYPHMTEGKYVRRPRIRSTKRKPSSGESLYEILGAV